MRLAVSLAVLLALSGTDLAAQKGVLEQRANLETWLDLVCTSEMSREWEYLERSEMVTSSGLDTIRCANCPEGKGPAGIPRLPGMTVSVALLDVYGSHWEIGVRGLATMRACHFRTRPAVGVGDDNARLRYWVDNDLDVHVVNR